ncbi:MAG: ABC transporter substrate-binding protein [Clostridiales bacterium]|nr:ABC transporter substrate-binding protein [Roseburia sp.]MDD7638064.1 ABC transporter substrate-binding protein [Clostridiales bacterium]MDY4114110.1 ABC transporter substrate-binding protein [Roseburia sp.]
MNWKKVVSVLLVSAMALSTAACGGSSESGSNAASGDAVTSGTENGGSAAASGEKLVVWTLANDLIDFGERFQEETGVEVETVVIEPADYPTKVQTALLGGETEPDIIVGEPQMLEDFYDAGFFEDLDQFGAQDYADQIVDYVWEVGQSSDGVQRAISYQITPAGIYYRRDIAKEVFGTDDPDEIGKLFADYATILETAQTLKDAGYRIFSSDAEINYFSGDSAWVIDGVLNVDQARYDYMDLCVDLYQKDLTAYANQWSTPWYQAMAGEVPILTADIQNYADDSVNVWDAEQFEEATKDMAKTEVFAFGLPSWGVLTMRDNVKDTSGLWGVCSGPSYGFGGGTYIGISSQSERKELAWDFVKFCTLNEDTANWWIEYSEGDTVSLIPVLEAHKDDANEVYGGEKLYAFWLQQAEGIDYSKVTRYDKAIGDAWGNAISAIKTGEKTKEEAVNEFYDVIESTYPDITVNR